MLEPERESWFLREASKNVFETNYYENNHSIATKYGYVSRTVIEFQMSVCKSFVAGIQLLEASFGEVTQSCDYVRGQMAFRKTGTAKPPR